MGRNPHIAGLHLTINRGLEVKICPMRNNRLQRTWLIFRQPNRSVLRRRADNQQYKTGRDEEEMHRPQMLEWSFRSIADNVQRY